MSVRAAAGASRMTLLAVTLGLAAVSACSPSPEQGQVQANDARDSQGAHDDAALVLAGPRLCVGSALELKPVSQDAGMGNRVLVLSLTNAGQKPCAVSGYPTIAVRDAAGRQLSLRNERNAGNYFNAGAANDGAAAGGPIGLAPGDSAYFDIAWNVMPHEDQGERVCPEATQLGVSLSGDVTEIVLAQEFTPCGGYVRVSPFRSVAAPQE